MNHDPFTTTFVIFILLTYPAIYISFGRYAWRGLRGRTTLTHFGVRSGWIARIYGLLYLSILIGLAAIIPMFMRYLREITLSELLSSFELPFKDQATGLAFLVLGLGFYLLIWWLRKYTQARYPEWAEKLKMRPKLYQYSVPSLLVIIGILFVVGSPIIFHFAVLLGWMYFASVTGEVQLLAD